jgi:hypothetical protein
MKIDQLHAAIALPTEYRRQEAAHPIAGLNVVNLPLSEIESRPFIVQLATVLIISKYLWLFLVGMLFV